MTSILGSPIVWRLEGVKMCMVATLQFGAGVSAGHQSKVMINTRIALDLYYHSYTES